MAQILFPPQKQHLVDFVLLGRSLKIALSTTLAACAVDPQSARDSSQSLIESIFPNPSDRQGIYFAFPLETGGFYSQVEIIYFSNEVSETEVTNRMTRYCLRYKSDHVSGQAYIRKRGTAGERTKPNVSVAPVATIFYSCFAPSNGPPN
ncbi:MAG: hypothetical protein ABJ139_00375 [Paracoccaceae bacterium]